MQAFAENSLLPEEMQGESVSDTEDALSSAANLCRSKLLANDEQRARKQSNMLRLERGLTPAQALQNIRGKKCFLAASAAACQLRGAMRAYGIVEVARLPPAQMIIVDRPGHIDNRSHAFLSGLLGLYEVSPSFLTEDGKGVALKLRPASFVKRVILVSTECAQANRPFWSFLRQVLPPGHNWMVQSLPVAQLKAASADYTPGLAFTVVQPGQFPLPVTGPTEKDILLTKAGFNHS